MSAAYRQLRSTASAADDGELVALCDARIELERRQTRERATLDQLRTERVALSDRLAAAWAADPDRDDSDDTDKIAAADAAIPAQEARCHGLATALDASERRIEEYVRDHAHELREAMRAIAREATEHAQVLEAEAAQARADATAATLGIYVAQPGSLLAPMLSGTSIRAPRRPLVQPEQGFADLDLPGEELFAVAHQLPGRRLTPHVKAIERARRLLEADEQAADARNGHRPQDPEVSADDQRRAAETLTQIASKVGT